MFDFRRGDGALLLLIIDRLDDPVTPLLSQWTYQVGPPTRAWVQTAALPGAYKTLICVRCRCQAMVHELLGIENNRVDLRSLGSKIAKENQELVLSAEQDAFFRAQMYSNYGARPAAHHGALFFARAITSTPDCMACCTPVAGDLGVAIKGMVDEFQAASKSNQNIQTIADMQRFVENYPEFRAKSGNVSKHVTLMGEMSRVIDERHLMKVSQLEQVRPDFCARMHGHHFSLATPQDLACGSPDRAVAFASVSELVEDPAVRLLHAAQCSTVKCPHSLQADALLARTSDPGPRETAARAPLRAALRARWCQRQDASRQAAGGPDGRCSAQLGKRGLRLRATQHVLNSTRFRRLLSTACCRWHARANAPATCSATRTFSLAL